MENEEEDETNEQNAKYRIRTEYIYPYIERQES